MFAIFWPIVFLFTGILYLLLLLFLPFSSEWATVMLFAIISFWSRLPGVGMPSPFYVLYLADFVDFFSLIVAVNIGGLAGGIFAFSLNMLSRLVGVYPGWILVTKDAISQFFVCLIIPFIHVALGGDIFISMIWYSILRILMFFPLRLLPNELPFPQALVNIIGGGIAVLFINASYARLFGKFFDGILEQGISFNWLLFLIVTAVILVALLYPKRRRRKKRIVRKHWDEKLKDSFNLHFYLFRKSFSKRMNRRKQFH
jgi:hypothetical protein